MNPPKLSSGVTGFYNDRNEWQATGSQMGRRSSRVRSTEPVKCYLRRVKMSACGCYDSEGAYWGQGAPLYRCNFDLGDSNEDIFLRAHSRADAKEQIREQLPHAKFFN